MNVRNLVGLKIEINRSNDFMAGYSFRLNESHFDDDDFLTIINNSPEAAILLFPRLNFRLQCYIKSHNNNQGILRFLKTKPYPTCKLMDNHFFWSTGLFADNLK